jgi:hypothetical protein
MPEIRPGVWRLAIDSYWVRRFEDGRVESEFDPLTGIKTKWGDTTPKDIIEVGWHPITPDLANKINALDEDIAVPSRLPPVIIQVKPGETLVFHKDRGIFHGTHAKCKSCGYEFLLFGDPTVCPSCSASSFEVMPRTFENTTYLVGIDGKFCTVFNGNMITTEY